MAIPQELYEAAAVDGASGLRRLSHVTLLPMANLYIVCVLLDTVFALGDFNATYFVSGDLERLPLPVHAVFIDPHDRGRRRSISSSTATRRHGTI
jgi:ABC-type sugar transport system permease subunit